MPKISAAGPAAPPADRAPRICLRPGRSGRRAALAGLLIAAAAARAADEPPPPDLDSDQAYQAAKQLFDQYAPPEVKQQYEFPSFEQFQQFARQLQAALDGGSLESLAQYEPQARAALALLRSAPEYAGYADWLAARLEEIDAARRITEAEKAPATPAPAPSPPAAGSPIPYFDLWYRRLRTRPPPANAAELMPRLRAAFAAEGVPPQLAWLAEVESSLDPDAASPAGARGLFQLKAETARSLGLSTFLPDERTDPEKAARAAARELRMLERRFGSWPLALAAYNAGEGRVRRALASRHADTFAGAAPALPAGTRMYVPEVCALVAVRTGLRL